MQVTDDEARDFLRRTLGLDTEVTELGAGAWSQCFGFDIGHAQMVVRFGPHGDDFEKDRLASGYNAEWLPIPEVIHVGVGPGGFAAISSRVPGHPLEDTTASDWDELVPTVVDIMEAIRTVRLPSPDTWGRWDASGRGSHASWRDFLLSVDDDGPTTRTPGWRATLAEHAEAERCFARGHQLLASLDVTRVERSLVHGDLLNRNVGVVGDTISGVYDWGASLYGDHLYELAWFQFWAPWHRQLDVDALTDALDEEWADIGVEIADRDVRLLACHLHIGLDHLAYSAHTGQTDRLDATIGRLHEVAPDL